MNQSRAYHERMERVFYFFPVQLLILHLKRNIVLLLFWALLFGIVTRQLLVRYGIPYLFLSPEYMGGVGLLSYLIIGLCCGAFIMTYHIASYATNGSRFPFLATLNRPFLKYSVNNSIIPAAFVVLYIWEIIAFYRDLDLLSAGTVIISCGGLLSGIGIFLLFSYIYFFSTNKNLFQLLGITKKTEDREIRAKLRKELEKRSHWVKSFIGPLKSQREWKVKTYLSGTLAIRLTRGTGHYDKDLLMLVFNQNHINATKFLAFVFVLLMAIGLLRDVPWFAIPAGGSIVLLFTLLLVVAAILYTWVRGWFTFLVIGGLVLFNYLSKYEWLSYPNRAYGLNYEVKPAHYTYKTLKVHTWNKDNYVRDFEHTKDILERWKEKNANSARPQHKPWMVMINASGGGLKSALWTFCLLQYADSIMGGRIMKQTQFISGSSGGLIGVSYLRELYLRKLNGEIYGYYDPEYLHHISRDLLNPVALSIAVRDIFPALQKFSVDGYTYAKDRGFAFEKALNENTGHLLDKRLSDYKDSETSALIPMIVFSPTIINDGRRLLISSQPIAYLAQNYPAVNIRHDSQTENVEYSRFFWRQDADNIRFTSVLRMNSTFPYIMPMISLPSKPVMEVIDAGARDNYGLKTTMKFIFTFREWLAENTQGVIILSIREKPRRTPIRDVHHRTALQATSTPVGSFYENMFNIQDYTNDELILYAGQWFRGTIEVIDFQLQDYEDEHISLSWHLTPKEKKQILNAIHLIENRKAMERLRQLLSDAVPANPISPKSKYLSAAFPAR